MTTFAFSSVVLSLFYMCSQLAICVVISPDSITATRVVINQFYCQQFSYTNWSFQKKGAGTKILPDWSRICPWPWTQKSGNCPGTKCLQILSERLVSVLKKNPGTALPVPLSLCHCLGLNSRIRVRIRPCVLLLLYTDRTVCVCPGAHFWAMKHTEMGTQRERERRVGLVQLN